jgi:hypothetical protein
MGNCKDHAEFFDHFRFAIKELLRVTIPGRLVDIHCKDLPTYKGRDGSAGLYDFPGDIIRNFVGCGWAYHSRLTIWKDPVIEMQRTKNHGLLYKNLRADSCCSRAGMADYLLSFRKWPVGSGDNDLLSFPDPVFHTREDFPLEKWQKWASPVWDDIRQTHVLNHRMARDGEDERHICPLQLDVIERCIELRSNPGDVVLDPFSGIGSTGYMALKMKRKYIGIELKESYFEWSSALLLEAEAESDTPNLLDLMEAR